MVKSNKDDEGEDHGIVGDDATDLIKLFDIAFKGSDDLPWLGKRVCT